jgi:hypothetical protein
MPCAEKLGRLQCTLWRLHDERKWLEFKDTVVSYVVELGYDREAANKASHHVASAYQYSDLASVAQGDKDKELERLHYDRVIAEFVEAHKLLGVETRSPVYKVGWYADSRHGDHIGVLYNLLMQHHSKFGLMRLGLTIRTTYIACARAYPAHSSHNWKELAAVLTDYWTAISEAYRTYKLPVEL